MTAAHPESREIDVEALLSAPREQIVAHQDRRIAEITEVAWRELGFYRRLVAERDGREARPSELGEWPLWNVADLRAAMDGCPPFGDVYTDDGLADIAFIHSSSGTTGKPRYTAFTRRDEPHLLGAYRRVAAMMGGLGPQDRIILTGGYGLPIGAWSFTRSAQAAGATVVPAGSGRITPSEKLIDTIHDLGVTVVQGAASYLLQVGRKARALGRPVSEAQVRLLWLSGEAALPEVRREIETEWGAPTWTMYANSDVGWVAAECESAALGDSRLGMHVLEDTARLEVLDPDGRACAPEEYGELVITSWLRPSTPRIRFRTGDRAALSYEPCACGRTSARLLPLAGRTDDAIRFHGTTIWPQAVEDVLTSLTGSRREYFIDLVTDDLGADRLRVTVERLASEPDSAVDPAEVTREIKARLGVSVVGIVAPPGGTAEETGLGFRPKVRRFVDRRVGR